ncbi:MAG: hypothetical protein S4CHLAM37_09890 [Chlamydiia bacterium]|nr:hypothetical protein [Chlamydiia bacterium]
MSGLQRAGVGTVSASHAGNRAQSFGGRMLNKGKDLTIGMATTVANLAAAALIVDSSRQAVTSFATKNPNDELVKILPSFVLKDGAKEVQFLRNAGAKVTNYFSQYDSDFGCESVGDKFTCRDFVEPTYGQVARGVYDNAMTSLTEYFSKYQCIPEGQQSYCPANNCLVPCQNPTSGNKIRAVFDGFMETASKAKNSISGYFAKGEPKPSENTYAARGSEYVTSAKALVGDVATAAYTKVSDVKDSVVNALSATNVSSDEFMENSMKLAAVGLAVGVTAFAVRKYRESNAAKSENKALIAERNQIAPQVLDLIAENKELKSELQAPKPRVRNHALRKERAKTMKLEALAQRQQAMIDRLVAMQTAAPF